jgi:hypothetical protein
MTDLFVSLKAKTFVLLGAVAVFTLSAWGEEELDTGKLTFHGFGSHETGQIVKGRHMNVDFEHQWLMREFANLTANYIANEHLRLAVGITARIWYETYPDAKRNPWFPRKQYFTVYPHVASGIFSYGLGDFAKIDLEAGYFPFKYNPDVRNLGEYLFRCNTYPPNVITNFDLTYSRLSGARVSGTFWEMLNMQVLFTQENELPSFYDPSLSILADVNYHKIFDIGGGIMFNRFMAVDSLATSAMSRLGPPSTYFDTVDSQSKTYTHAGVKLMGRFSFDPKRLFLSDDNGIFGENDLRLYGEIAVLGWKNYQGYYDDKFKRIPRMIGFNVPCFKVLDVAAVELEYNPWNYSNGYLWVVMDGTAVPNTANGDYTADDYGKDDWKWTVYLKRTFYRHCYLMLQFANDHWSLPQYDEKNYDRDEFCGRPSHWYWMAKFGVTF